MAKRKSRKMAKKAAKRIKSPTPSLHLVLRRELKLRFNPDLQIGQLRLFLLSEPYRCEGIATPGSEEEYLQAPGPPSPDFIVRGSCGGLEMPIGTVMIRQSLVRGFDFPLDRVCCLDCAIQFGVVIRTSKKHGSNRKHINISNAQ
jgi:hypothetical protein